MTQSKTVTKVLGREMNFLKFRGKTEVLIKFKVKANILAKNKLQNLQNSTIKPSKQPIYPQNLQND